MFRRDRGQLGFLPWVIDYQSSPRVHVCVRVLKVLLGDKCQSNRKENINFSIVKVRCVPRVIVIGIFIVATVMKGILSWGSFFQVSREKGSVIPQHACTLLGNKVP